MQSQEDMLEAASLVRPEDQEIYADTWRRASTRLSGSDGHVDVQIGAGGFQGATTITDTFNEVYWQTLVPWQQADAAKHPELCAPSVLHQGDGAAPAVDLSLTVFVDDLSKSALVEGLSRLAARSEELDTGLNVALERVGLAQNRDKREALVAIVGEGSHNNFKSVVNR